MHVTYAEVAGRSATRCNRLLQAHIGRQGQAHTALADELSNLTDKVHADALELGPRSNLCVASPRRSPAITPGCLEDNAIELGVKRKFAPILVFKSRTPGEPCGSAGRFRGHSGRTK